MNGADMLGPGLLIATLATVPLIWTPVSLQGYHEALHAKWHIYLIAAQLVMMPLFCTFGAIR